MSRRLWAIGCLLVLSSSVVCQELRLSGIWEKDIAKFEAADKASPPAPGGIVFVGSSSIKLWDLKKSFPKLDALNRGFGGSQLADSVYFCDRIVTKYQPRVIVLYAGDNDIAHGKSPQAVCDDLANFVKRVRAKLPEAEIIFLSIKPSIKRWEQIDKQRQANKCCAELLQTDPHALFLDIGTGLLGENGKPDPKFFVEDGLHLSRAGYKVWAELLQPHLAE